MKTKMNAVNWASGVAVILMVCLVANMPSCLRVFTNSNPLRLSTKNLIKEIRGDYGLIPDSAYDIYYHNSKGRDPSRWISYRASEEDIHSFLEKMRKEVSDRRSSWPTAPRVIQSEGNKKVTVYEDWWPNSTKGLEVIQGEYFSVGYDPISNRIYYYIFTT